MPIGAFKLNTISAASGTPAESYFIMTNTGLTSISSIEVDTSKNIYLSNFSKQVVRVSETGSIDWQKTLTTTGTGFNKLHIVGTTLRCNIDYWASAGVTYPYGYVALNLSNGGSSSYYSVRTSSGNSGFGNTTPNSVEVDYDSTGTFYCAYRGSYSGYTRNLMQQTTSWQKTGYSSLNSDLFKPVVITNSIIAFFGNTFVQFRNSGGTILSTKTWITSMSDGCTDGTNLFLGGSRVIQKINSGYTQSWSKQLSTGACSMYNQTMACDSSGNIYIVSSPTSSAATIIKLDTNGNIVAQRSFTMGTSVNSAKCRIRNGQLYIFGDYTNGASNLGYVMKLPLTLPSNGTYGPVTFTTPTFTIANFTNGLSDSSPLDVESNTISTSTQTITYSTPTFTSFTKQTI